MSQEPRGELVDLVGLGSLGPFKAAQEELFEAISVWRHKVKQTQKDLRRKDRNSKHSRDGRGSKES